MKKNIFLLKILIVYFLLIPDVFTAASNYFDDGRKLFNKKEFEKSKIFFEKDIVFNPKNEKSYLYLAKIFNKNEIEVLEIDEKTLNINVNEDYIKTLDKNSCVFICFATFSMILIIISPRE